MTNQGPAGADPQGAEPGEPDRPGAAAHAAAAPARQPPGLVTVYVTGRKSGRRYAVPVAYTRHEGDLLIGSPFGWGRNLRTGEPVTIRLKGRRRLADVLVLADEQEVVDAYAVMARDNHAFAKFNNIGFDPDGNPVPADLRLAWAAGARAFRLTPH